MRNDFALDRLPDESDWQFRRRKAAAKFALQQREMMESLGFCRCSDEQGNLNHKLPNGCPKHPGRPVFVSAP